MVRSRWRLRWIGRVFGLLTCTGLAVGQQPAPVPMTAQTAQVITVQETGKPPQKCTVLRTWQKDGVTAYHVQSLTTGKTMTLMDPTGSVSKTGTIHIVAMPKPAAPPGATTHSTTIAQTAYSPSPTLPVPVAGPAAITAEQHSTPVVPPFQAEEVLTIQEAGKPAEKCKVLSAQKRPDGLTEYHVKSLTTGETSTFIQPASSADKTNAPRVIPPERVPTPPVVALPVTPAKHSETQAVLSAPNPVWQASTVPAPVVERHMPTTSTTEEILTVQEPGKPGQKAKVLKSWKQADGSTAYLVQSLATGETMTLTQPKGSTERTIVTRVVPPERVSPTPVAALAPAAGPALPVTAAKHSEPQPTATAPSPSKPASTVPAPIVEQQFPATSASDEILTVQEPGKPNQKVKVLKSWKQADGSTAYQVKSLATGEMLTLIEPANAVGKVIATTTPVLTKVVESRPEVKPIEAVATTRKAPAPAPPLPPATAAKQPSAWPSAFVGQAPLPADNTPKVATAPSPPADWRQSWGNMQTTKPTMLPAADGTPPVPQLEVPTWKPVVPPVPVQVTAPKPVAPAPVQVATPAPAAPAPVQVATPTPAAPAPVQVATPTPAAPVPVQVAAPTPPAPPVPVAQVVTPTPAPAAALPPVAPPAPAMVLVQPAILAPTAPTPPVAPPALVVNAPPSIAAPAPAAPAVKADPVALEGKDTPRKMTKADMIDSGVLARTMQSVDSINRPTQLPPAGPAAPVGQVTAAGPVVPAAARMDGTPKPMVVVNPNEPNAFQQTRPGQPKAPDDGLNAFALPPATPAPVPQGALPNPWNPTAQSVSQTSLPPANMTQAMPYPPMVPQGMPYPPMVPQGMPYPPMMPQGMPMMAQGMPPRMPMPRPAVDEGVPMGMANAFTVGGTSRPLPPDFGPPEVVPNAFTSQVVGEMPSPRPQMMPAPIVVMPPPMMPPGQMPIIRDPAVAQALAALRDAPLPSHREMAAEQLASFDWHAQPIIVGALLVSAKDDPAPTVRAGCIRVLAKMKVAVPEVVAVLQTLKNDKDERVRKEVDQMLPTMTVAAPPPAGDSTVRPVSAKQMVP